MSLSLEVKLLYEPSVMSCRLLSCWSVSRSVIVTLILVITPSSVWSVRTSILTVRPASGDQLFKVDNRKSEKVYIYIYMLQLLLSPCLHFYLYYLYSLGWPIVPRSRGRGGVGPQILIGENANMTL